MVLNTPATDPTTAAIIAHNLSTMERDTKAVYRERAHLVGLLAAIYPSYRTSRVDSAGYHIVYVELPTGQASWHIHPDDMYLMEHVRIRETVAWDGHTTAVKYSRIDQLADELKGLG